ncbi:hypothetical protein D3C81_1127460 [compost metagenome]
MMPCGFINTASARNREAQPSFRLHSAQMAAATIMVKKESTCPQNVALINTAGLNM